MCQRFWLNFCELKWEKKLRKVYMDEREAQFLHSCLARYNPQRLTVRAFWLCGLETSNEAALLSSNGTIGVSQL